MAGLLDFNDPETRMGIGLLALSQMPRSQTAQGLMGLLASQDQAAKDKADAEWTQLQTAKKRQEMDATAKTEQAKAERLAAIPSLYEQGAGGGLAGFNVQRAVALGMDPDTIQKYAALPNVGRQEVARTIETTDGQGRPITVQLDKFGNRIGEGLGAWKAPVMVNQGAQITAVDPATLQARGSFGVSMSPAERDASARGWAGQNLARERFAMEQQQGGKPTFNAEAGGFIVPPSQNNPQGGIIPLQGFQKPLNDVQAKAQLFGTRMQEADKIMSDLQKGGKSFSTPGANAPFIGGLVNAVNTEQGQMLDQAKRDFTNAVLRRESGAAIAPSEFDSADKQYFPQIGDSEKVIEQKARARQIAIQGILSEVPKGTPPIRVDGGQSGGATGGWNGGPVPKTPMKGQVIGGFRYKGGDPADQSNWEKQ